MAPPAETRAVEDVTVVDGSWAVFRSDGQATHLLGKLPIGELFMLIDLQSGAIVSTRSGYLDPGGNRLSVGGANQPTMVIEFPDTNTRIHTQHLSIPFGGPIEISRTTYKRRT